MSYAPLDRTAVVAVAGTTIPYGGVDDSDHHNQDADDDTNSRASHFSYSSISLGRKKQPPQNASLVEPLTAKDEEEEASQEDPFYVFRRDLRRQLETMDESLTDFLRVVHNTDTAVNGAELRDAKKQLKRHIKAAESTLRDVQTTVQLVEQSRDKFSHISDSELYDRQSIVHTSLERLDKARSAINSDAVRAKQMADERAQARRRYHNGSSTTAALGTANDAQQHNDNIIHNSQARTSLLMQHQDETLDDLGLAVTRVGEMAESIHDEIGQQNKLLDEMADDLDKAEEDLGVVMGKLAKFLHTKDRWQLGTILCLTLVVIVLFMLVLYT